MIKYWQIGAEDFVSPEQAAIIRSDRPSPEQGDELDWLSKNLANVCGPYSGQCQYITMRLLLLLPICLI